MCGFQIVTVIADNNKINRAMFKSFCDGELKSSFQNPLFPGQSIFLLFDSVHLLISIRNNWLNQKESNQTFIFPSFEEENSEIYHASVHHLKKNV